MMLDKLVLALVIIGARKTCHKPFISLLGLLLLDKP